MADLLTFKELTRHYTPEKLKSKENVYTFDMQIVK
jgi:hypothetical protein